MRRVFVPRISIPTDYADCTEGTDPLEVTECASNTDPNGELRELAESAALRARTAPTVDAIHAAAIIDLQWGYTNKATLQRVIARLSAASLASPTPGVILADLAAAQVILAEREHDALALLSALDAAQRAASAAPTSAAARFNLALVAERLGLSARAEREWVRFVAADTASAWAADSRRRIARLKAERLIPPTGSIAPSAAAGMIRSDAGIARAHGFIEELGAWGQAIVDGNLASAASHLETARVIGEQLEEKGLDRSLADAVGRIDEASSVDRIRLAKAHTSYARASNHYADADFVSAAALYDSAAKDAPSSVVLRGWALVNRGAALALDTASIKTGFKILDSLARSVDTLRYPALAGRVQWCLSIVRLRGEDVTRGASAATRAMHFLDRARERENLGAVQVNRSEIDFRNGREREAATMMLAASRNLRRLPASRWRHNLLFGMARLAERSDLPSAAAVIREEDMEVARNTGKPVYSTEVLLERALANAKRGDHAAAIADFVAADEAIRRMATPFARNWFFAVASVHAAMAGLAERGTSLDDAVKFFGPRGKTGADTLPVSSSQYLAALLARADARRAVNENAARRDMDRAMAIIRTMGRALKGTGEKAALVQSARPTFSRAAMAELAAGRERIALATVERSRLRRASETPNSLTAPSGTTVIDVLLVGDTLLAWTIKGAVVRVHRTTLNAKEFERAVDRAIAGLQLGLESRQDLEALYEWLIAPLSRELGDSSTLVFVADGVLASIPFQALRDRRSGQFLIEHHPVVVVGALADGPPGAKSASGGRAVLIADPAFDRSRHPGLDRLPGASAEVAGIAALYDKSTVLSGAAATREAVISTLRNASIIHVAAHAEFDQINPGRSRIVLAESSDAHGDLTAEDLAQQSFRNSPLVVLAACESIRGASSVRSASLPGLGEALFAAGAGGIVGALWQIDDAATASMMQVFYEQFRRSNDAASALRSAQLAMLRSKEPALRSPGTWAAFRYAGR